MKQFLIACAVLAVFFSNITTILAEEKIAISPSRVSESLFCDPLDFSGEMECPEIVAFCSYNTFTTDYFYLEISNNALSTTIGHIYMFDNNGKLIADPELFVVGGMARYDLELQATLGRDAIGQVAITGTSHSKLLRISAAMYKNEPNRGLHLMAHVPCEIRRFSDVAKTMK